LVIASAPGAAFTFRRAEFPFKANAGAKATQGEAPYVEQDTFCPGAANEQQRSDILNL
jgi:hypothetical protein